MCSLSQNNWIWCHISNSFSLRKADCKTSRGFAGQDCVVSAELLWGSLHSTCLPCLAQSVVFTTNNICSKFKEAQRSASQIYSGGVFPEVNRADKLGLIFAVGRANMRTILQMFIFIFTITEQGNL